MDKAKEDALIVIAETKQALANGVKHYRKSDGMELTSVKEILEALLNEGSVILKKQRLNIVQMLQGMKNEN